MRPQGKIPTSLEEVSRIARYDDCSLLGLCASNSFRMVDDLEDRNSKLPVPQFLETALRQ